MISSEITLINKLGLHARAAAKLSSAAGRFACKIRISCDGKKPIDAKSVMSIMLLAASKGTTLHLEFDGDDEIKAQQYIEKLINDRFGEAE